MVALSDSATCREAIAEYLRSGRELIIVICRVCRAFGVG